MKHRYKPQTRKRRTFTPMMTGPIPDNAEYREMVEQILEDKRRRDVIADIMADKRAAQDRVN